MKKIFRYLLEYQRKHFDPKLYLTIVLFLTGCFIFNYYYDFEDSVLDQWNRHPLDWVNMIWWQGVPFLAVCFILYVFGKKKDWLRSGEFWIKFGIGFSLLALDRSFYGHIYLRDFFSYADYVFVAKCIKWMSSLVISVVPLLLVYKLFEQDNPGNYYGLQLKRFDARPYLILLGLAAIAVGVGSFFGDLQEYYPRYQSSGGELFARNHGISEAISVFLYELTYGVDFISVELYFRGFMIYAFARTLGGYAVLPMVASYAVLHFGKPLTEAVSSVFGGYILGIISYYSRSIWGGVMIHMGVAWIMELFGYLQRLM